MTGKAAPIETANFGFLAKHDDQLMRLGALAEWTHSRSRRRALPTGPLQQTRQKEE
jgi:hypothetical protein